MSDIEKMGNTQISDIFSDPFNKSSIKRIHVSFRERSFNLGWIAEGSVEFKNGKTSGEQQFEGTSFDDVVQQIKTFINTEL